MNERQTADDVRESVQRILHLHLYIYNYNYNLQFTIQQLQTLQTLLVLHTPDNSAPNLNLQRTYLVRKASTMSRPLLAYTCLLMNSAQVSVEVLEIQCNSRMSKSNNNVNNSTCLLCKRCKCNNVVQCVLYFSHKVYMRLRQGRLISDNSTYDCRLLKRLDNQYRPARRVP